MKISLDRNELELLKLAHQAIFSEVLQIKPTCLKPVCELAEKNYLVTPVQMILPETIDNRPASCLLEVFIDMESCRQLSELIRKVSADQASLYKPVRWPVPLDRFQNTIVVANHDVNKKLHEVHEVSSKINLSSPFVSPKAAPTYQSYFRDKYPGVTLTDGRQPALICKVLGTAQAYLQLLTSRFNLPAGEDRKKSDKRGRMLELFPELCSFYPLPTNLWKLARCLPSILWRMESFLAIDSLRCRILRETGMGLYSDGSELTTSIKVTGYKDLGAGQLKSQKYVPGASEKETKMLSSFDCNPVEYPLRSPDNALLLQALTTKSATDCVDLERLETLGDSFLKFSTTVFLYCDRLGAHEGRLSSARSRRVENFNLFYLAKCKGIPDFILSKIFEPRQMWIPPVFHFGGSGKEDQQAADSASLSEDMRNYLYHRLTDKGVADSIESLIGAYLVSGGILAGLKFMKWVGIKITSSVHCSVGGTGMRDNELFGRPVIKSPLGADFTSVLSLTPRSRFARPVQPAYRFAQPRRERSPEPMPLLISNSSVVLRKFFNPDTKLWNLDYNRIQSMDMERLLYIALAEKKSDDIIGWRFKNRSLLLQALTHASYTRNRLTDSYQRLEFLGDAILDYLVTCHIYKRFPEYQPGQISCMRSALVDNISFADLAVRLKLHTILLHNSPALMKHIELFLKNQVDNLPADCDETFYEPSSLLKHVSSIIEFIQLMWALYLLEFPKSFSGSNSNYSIMYWSLSLLFYFR